VKRIIVTPAGRRRYVEILARHLSAQRSSFDEWHIWLNTTDHEDATYCRSLEAKVIDPPDSRPHERNSNIYRFFAVDSCLPDAAYLRLDDDIVWMEPGFIDSMFSFREKSDAFLVSANVVNNAICSHLHWKNGVAPECGYACMDDIGWKSSGYAEDVHRRFLSSDLERWKFGTHRLPVNHRISINAISWLGAKFATFSGAVGVDEENWLTEQAPASLGDVVIHGRAVCVHFAFHTQRGHLDATDLLDCYRRVAP
jgi:hypothetical protein